jgi:hypothetical protein
MCGSHRGMQGQDRSGGRFGQGFAIPAALRSVIDTEEAESTESISHRDTKTQRHKDTENLCVSVSPWLIYL